MAGPLEAFLVYLALALGSSLGLAMAWRKKTRPENVHRHPSRARILGWLTWRPGTNVRELTRELDLKRGTAQYHLHILERAGAIQGATTGRDHQYFPPGTPLELRRAAGLLRRRWSLPLVLRIMDRPGILQKDLTGSLGISRKVLRAYVRLLKGEDLVDERREGHRRRYHPTPKLLRVLENLPLERPPDRDETPDPRRMP